MDFESKDKSYSEEVPELKKTKEIPRRCIIIRRTFPSDNREKTELKFVVYKNPSDKFNPKNIFEELTEFLEKESKNEKVSSVASSINSKRATTASETKETTSATTVATTTKGSKCAQVKALRGSVPLIKELIAYFKKLESKNKTKDTEAVRVSAEKLLADILTVLDDGRPISKLLFHRIRELNRMAESFAATTSRSYATNITTTTVVVETSYPVDI